MCVCVYIHLCVVSSVKKECKDKLVVVSKIVLRRIKYNYYSMHSCVLFYVGKKTDEREREREREGSL